MGVYEKEDIRYFRHCCRSGRRHSILVACIGDIGWIYCVSLEDKRVYRFYIDIIYFEFAMANS